MIMITFCLTLREDKALLKIARFCRHMLIEQREIGLECQKLISFRKVPIAGFQVVTWTFLNCLPMAMSVVGKTLVDVEFNSFYSCIDLL